MAFEGNVYPPITLITGPRNSGRTTYAVLICAELFKRGVPCFHNSTASIGWNVEKYVDSYDGLLSLAEQIPEPSTVLIEELTPKGRLGKREILITKPSSNQPSQYWQQSHATWSLQRFRAMNAL